MSKDGVKVLPTLIDGCRKANDFRARSNYNQKFEFSIVGKFYILVIRFHFDCFRLVIEINKIYLCP